MPEPRVKRTVVVYEFDDGTFDAQATELGIPSAGRDGLSRASGAQAVGFVAAMLGDPVRDAVRALLNARWSGAVNTEDLTRLRAAYDADPVKTKSGKWLTSADFEAFADEEER